MHPLWSDPILLIHGALSDASVWRPHLAALKRAKWDVYAPDLDGFVGPSILASRPSSDTHVAQLTTLLHQIGRPTHVVGHSRGGRLAFHLAAEHPDFVRSLILVEPGGAKDVDFLDDKTLPPAPTDSSMIAMGTPEAVARRYIEAGHGTGAWRRLPALNRAAALRTAHTLDFTLGDKTRALSRPVARRIACPSLIIVGDASPPIFAAIGVVLAKEIAEARLEVIEGADHFYPTVRPADFIQRLSAFLLSPKSFD